MTPQTAHHTTSPLPIAKDVASIIAHWSVTQPVQALMETEQKWREGESALAIMLFSTCVDLWTYALPQATIEIWSDRIAESDFSWIDPLYALSLHPSLSGRQRVAYALSGLQRRGGDHYTSAADIAGALLPLELRAQASQMVSAHHSSINAYHKVVTVSETLREIINTSSTYFRARETFLPPVPGPATIVYDSGLEEWDLSSRVEVFPFFQESKMLETRLAVGKGAFDAHLLIEGATNYRGQPKSSVFLESFSDEYRRRHRIRHIIVAFPETENPWVRERLQRDASLPLLMDLESDALIVSSDLDEIIDPKKLTQIADTTKIAPCSIEQDVFFGGLHGFRSDGSWCHAKAFRRIDLPESLSALRLSSLQIVKAAGWHLSYFGTPQEIEHKLRSFAHSELDEITSTPQEIDEFLYTTNHQNNHQPSVPIAPEIIQYWGSSNT